eukprot:Sro167_g074530.2  (133) ;mRNA; r:65357-65755
MSGVSSIRSSTASSPDFSDMKMYTRIHNSYSLSLLRESIMSDISDCDSVMDDGDQLAASHLLGGKSGDDVLAFQAEFDAGVQNAALEPRPFPPTQQPQRRAKRSRMSSIMSISMASTISLLSLGSTTSWGAF